MVKLNGKQTRAHRVSLEIKVGRRLGVGEVAMHTCDNPGCYEPSHLEVGTVMQNNRSRRVKEKSFANELLDGWRELY